jgi:hypothetical protein
MILLSSTLIYAQKSGHETAVAVFKTKDTIAMAADSRITWTILSNNPLDKPSLEIADSICKIFVNKYFIFSAAEFAFFDKTNYNIFNIAKEICSKPGNIYEKYNAIQNKVINELTKICKYVKQTGFPTTLDKMKVDFIIGGIYKNELTLLRNVIVPLETTWIDGKIEIHDIFLPDSLARQDCKALMGVIINREDVFSLPEVKDNYKSPSIYVYNIVKWACNNYSDVGGDIAVACFTKRGFTWNKRYLK